MQRRGRRSWFHAIVYALAIAVTIYAVIDLDHPRSGLIRLDAFDQALVNVRNSMR